MSKPRHHEHTRLDSQCILQQFRSVRSSDPLGASFFTTQGLFFFFFSFFALFLSKSTTTTASPAVPKDEACSIQKKRQADAHLCPSPLTKTVIVAIFSAPKRKRQRRWQARRAGTSKFCAYSGVLSQHLRPQRQTGNQFRCPRLSQADDTVLLSTVIGGDISANFPKIAKFRNPELQPNSGVRNFAPTRHQSFFSN
jgi:hypothetical protein